GKVIEFVIVHENRRELVVRSELEKRALGERVFPHDLRIEISLPLPVIGVEGHEVQGGTSGRVGVVPEGVRVAGLEDGVRWTEGRRII
ncbi:hypothetical protein ABTL85_19090, partial [Acinetobacter baumannii]